MSDTATSPAPITADAPARKRGRPLNPANRKVDTESLRSILGADADKVIARFFSQNGRGRPRKSIKLGVLAYRLTKDGGEWKPLAATLREAAKA